MYTALAPHPLHRPSTTPAVPRRHPAAQRWCARYATLRQLLRRSFWSSCARSAGLCRQQAGHLRRRSLQPWLAQGPERGSRLKDAPRRCD
eukprot:scaffold266631_cov19-Tisochrysis_lutea.AAC.1